MVLAKLLNQGYTLIPNILSAEDIDHLREQITSVDWGKNSGGIRNAEKKLPIISALSKSNTVTALAQQYLQQEPKLVRAIIFDKTPESNWLVTWHQDKTVALNQRFNSDDWGPWSLKDNVLHVQPPQFVLERMVTVRIHLDDANEANGCLKVIPNTHDKGILTQSEITEFVSHSEVIHCIANAGDALVMRPLLLHASSKMVSSKRRRVIHFEYSDYPLPADIYWH